MYESLDRGLNREVDLIINQWNLPGVRQHRLALLPHFHLLRAARSNRTANLCSGPVFFLFCMNYVNLTHQADRSMRVQRVWRLYSACYVCFIIVFKSVFSSKYVLQQHYYIKMNTSVSLGFSIRFSSFLSSRQFVF